MRSGYPVVAGPPGTTSPGIERLLELELGLQSVEDSDGAARVAVHVALGGMGLALSDVRYFERGPAMDGSDTIYMDVWAVAMTGRLLHMAGTELWLSGGLGGASSNEFETLMGPTIGAEIEHAFGANLTVRGGARYFALEKDTRVGELSAGLGVAFLSVGYRVLRFNVGPSLHGPEFGLTLRF